jgi:zinc and cadmium transporter
MTTYIYAFFGVIIVSLVSLVGVFFLSLGDSLLKKYVQVLISLAIGGLLGDAFIHLIPESFKEIADKTLVGILIIAGIIFFFSIEKLIHWHHHGEDKENNQIHPVGKLILFTDGFHNMIDGIILGVSFIVSLPVGIATTLAIILHEIPQEIGDFAVLIHSGYTKKKALIFNFFSALMAVLGMILAFSFGKVIENYLMLFLPIAAGGFIYIAVADLIPELQKTIQVKRSLVQISAVLLGVFLMLALTFLE